MAEAQDVYYVRTEDYDGFKTEANAQMLDYYYSDVPLEQYFQQRLEEKVCKRSVKAVLQTHTFILYSVI